MKKLLLFLGLLLFIMPVKAKTVYSDYLEFSDWQEQEIKSSETIKVETKKKILSRYKREAGKKYSKIFNIQEDDLIYYIKRLNFQGDQPIAIEDIYIPYSLVDKVEGLDLTIFSRLSIVLSTSIPSVREINPVTIDFLKHQH